MTRNRGWSKAGTKAFSNPTHQRKSERYTLMLAVSHQKVVAWQLVENSANKDKLCDFLGNRLVPAMQAHGLEELLLDNARTHHSKDVKKLWEEDFHMNPFIFNPPYNPDSNPIEMVFSIIKRKLRKIRPETKADMEQAIADTIQSDVTAEKLSAIFRHALKR
jgi:transposase